MTSFLALDLRRGFCLALTPVSMNWRERVNWRLLLLSGHQFPQYSEKMEETCV